jgi:hypothetical protein
VEPVTYVFAVLEILDMLNIELTDAFGVSYVNVDDGRICRSIFCGNSASHFSSPSLNDVKYDQQSSTVPTRN